jgi:DNA-binding MarR family transcriptional regulator
MTTKPHNNLEPGTAREIAESCLANALRRADRAAMQYYDEALRPFGLKMTQMSLLVALRLTEPATVRKLASTMVLDRTTLTRNLGALERQGLVAVAPGEDRRTRQVSLSRKGHALLAKAYPQWRKAQARVEHRLGADRTRRLVAELAGTVEALGRR